MNDDPHTPPRVHPPLRRCADCNQEVVPVEYVDGWHCVLCGTDHGNTTPPAEPSPQERKSWVEAQLEDPEMRLEFARQLAKDPDTAALAPYYIGAEPSPPQGEGVVLEDGDVAIMQWGEGGRTSHTQYRVSSRNEIQSRAREMQGDEAGPWSAWTRWPCGELPPHFFTAAAELRRERDYMANDLDAAIERAETAEQKSRPGYLRGLHDTIDYVRSDRDKWKQRAETAERERDEAREQRERLTAQAAELALVNDRVLADRDEWKQRAETAERALADSVPLAAQEGGSDG